MKSGVLRKCVIFLSVLVVFSQARGNDCWVEHEEKEYQSLAKMEGVNGIKRCRSYCSDLNQLSENKGGGCNVITLWKPIFSPNYWCYLAKEAKPANATLVYNMLEKTYIMKDHCQYSSCWNVSEDKNQKLDLKEVASLTEKQCKLRCMETWKCYHVAFTNNKCYIQYWNAKLNSVTSTTIGTIYRVDNRCKDERCWEMFHDEIKAWMPLVKMPEATDEFHCRELCLKFWRCNIYIWKYMEADQTQRCWVMQAKIGWNPYHKGVAVTGVNCWVMKRKCHDWYSNGYLITGDKINTFL